MPSRPDDRTVDRTTPSDGSDAFVPDPAVQRAAALYDEISRVSGESLAAAFPDDDDVQEAVAEGERLRETVAQERDRSASDERPES